MLISCSQVTMLFYETLCSVTVIVLYLMHVRSRKWFFNRNAFLEYACIHTWLYFAWYLNSDILVLDLAEAKNTKKARLHSQIYDVYSIPSPTDGNEYGRLDHTLRWLQIGITLLGPCAYDLPCYPVFFFNHKLSPIIMMLYIITLHCNVNWVLDTNECVYFKGYC